VNAERGMRRGPTIANGGESSWDSLILADTASAALNLGPLQPSSFTALISNSALERCTRGPALARDTVLSQNSAEHFAPPVSGILRLIVEVSRALAGSSSDFAVTDLRPIFVCL
jgi:hypothetical protein